jgi:tetratricopeptide (TPR) repeat protein
MTTLRRVESEEPAKPSRLCRKLPRDLETICLKCLAKEPSKRYASALDLADDLRRFLDGKPIAARPAGMGERAWKWVKRRPATAALIGVSVAAALALAVLGIGWSIHVQAERDHARQSLQIARKAIDDLYTKMASERLFDEPQLDPLCQDLLERAQLLYEELSREHSDDPDIRRDIALAWFRLGEIHRLRDQHRQAEQAYGEAISRQEKLQRDNSEEPRYRQELANSHNWLGEVLRECNRPRAEAERHYRAALELQLNLVGQFPKEPAYRMELARSYYNLGLLHKDTNRLREARADYDLAVELLANVPRTAARDPNVRQDLARAYINRGVLHRLNGRLKEAGRDYDRAITLLAGLRDQFHTRAAYKFELAIARQDRGNLYWSQAQNATSEGQRQESLANTQREHRQALVLLRGLVADFSGRSRYQKKMGNVLKNLGSALALSGHKRDAEKHWVKARTIFEGLVKSNSEVADYHGLLGMTLGNLGCLRAEEEKWHLARKLLKKAIAQLQTALEPNPLHPDYRRELRNRYQDLGWTLVQLGDHPAAVRVATKLADVFPKQAQDSYNSACFVARCVPLARKNDKTARTYVQKAINLLRNAADHASPSLKRIKDENPVFQALKEHPDFEEVMGKLNQRSKRPRDKSREGG